MKLKTIALFLILSLSAWAQTVTTPNQTTPQAQPKASCSDCCKHMSGDKDAKDAKDCCHDMNATGDAKHSCCQGKDCMGKDAMACMTDATGDKGKCCNEKDGKGCCSHADHDKTAMACCSGDQCGKEHEHIAMN